MSMSKKDFIALADAVRGTDWVESPFDNECLEILATFCKRQNPAFMHERWLRYIRGENGSNGGKVK